nr:unknown [uncultured bacterium]
MTDHSSGRAAKAFFVFRYHPIPDMGLLHLPCMLFRAPLCVSSPLATISFKWLSCAFITSSALLPWNGALHGPPICLHVIVFTYHVLLVVIRLSYFVARRFSVR